MKLIDIQKQIVESPYKIRDIGIQVMPLILPKTKKSSIHFLQEQRTR